MIPSKTRFSAVLCFLLAAAARAAFGGTVVSLNFDDETADQLAARPILEQRGLKATFVINSGRVGTSSYYMTAADIQAIQAAGHEIAGHTIDHVDLRPLSSADLQRQICDDRAALLALGLNVNDFAYPYGDYNAGVQAAVRACGYRSARSLGGIACANCAAAESVPPADPFAIRTPALYPAATALADMERTVTDAENAGGGWVPIVIHRVCDGCAPDAISPADLASFADFLLSRAVNGVAVRTMSEVLSSGGTPDNPTPALASISPTSAAAGGPAFTLAASGSGFLPGSVVRWNGQDRPTSFVSTARLNASIPASDVASPGSAAVTVFTPAPGGGTSASVSFAVTTVNPAPSVTALTPSRATAGSGGMVVSVSGAGFMAGTEVFWNGQRLSAVYLSSVQVNASLPAADLAAPTTATVTVLNAAPGGGSYSVSFVVEAQSAAVPALGGGGEARVYPNPWRADRDRGQGVVFDGLAPDSRILIYTLDGRSVRALTASGGRGTWDLNSDSGGKAASGLYLYLVTDSAGRRLRGTFAVVE